MWDKIRYKACENAFINNIFREYNFSVFVLSPTLRWMKLILAFEYVLVNVSHSVEIIIRFQLTLTAELSAV